MEKAKLIRSITERCFNEHFLIYEYEYRGYRYTVYVNLNKGNDLHLLAVSEYEYQNFIKSLGLDYNQVKDKGILLGFVL